MFSKHTYFTKMNTGMLYVITDYKFLGILICRIKQRV
jgi:hypothetical protein